ncbi:DNA adenine methylase [Nocardioides convexus]|uniref:DNA adenine methylase n=1 Tax=Nocardioides convexus TaxID=2712224 RepID=UPI0024183C78|nr:DNA adenine methylase [Nocardioides convexus]
MLGECYVTTDAGTVDLAALDAEPGAACRAARPAWLLHRDVLRAGPVLPAPQRDAGRRDPRRDRARAPAGQSAARAAADQPDARRRPGGLHDRRADGLPQGVGAALLRRDSTCAARSLLPGPGATVTGDVLATVEALPPVDLAYVDPPYNQHRYFANYHIWETLVRWDAPEHYGIACKRVDVRERRSVFNSRRTMPGALADVLARLRAEVVVVSYNDESWISAEEMTASLRDAGHREVAVLAFDRKRYVGAQIGIHGPTGQRVGEVGRLRNVEYVFVAGDPDRVEAAAAAGTGATAGEPMRLR